MTPRPRRRNRALYIGVTLAVILLGLATRKYPAFVPDMLGKYPGDALWALMVFTACCVLWPGASTAKLAAAALGISFAVEFSQLYQAPWIDAIRASTAGHLVLGSSFHGLDLLAYAVGVSAGAAIECCCLRVVAWHTRRAAE